MKVLIVEDEVSLATVIKEFLILEKYTVDAVYNGQDGYDYAIGGIYDVILLDIMLPKMSGLEVLKKLRSKKISTPIIMLSAKSEVDDKIQGLDFGADDYVTKPFETKELLARIRSVSRRKDIFTSAISKVGNLIFEKNNLTIKTNFNSIKLSLKEYQILEMLILNKSQLILKEQIVDKVWGYDFDGEYNIVEVYISFIRKKLKFIKSNVTIKASRGLGYSLEIKND